MNKMNIKKAGIMLLTILLLMSLVACGGEEVEDAEDLVEVDEEVETEEGKIRVEDDYGSVFESDEPAKTVVSLAPSNTEILFALGLDDEIIGVTDFCNYPEEALDKEKVGGYSETNLEKVIELDPDLVLFSGMIDEDTVTRLEEANIVALGFEDESIEEIVESIEKIGIAMGKEEEAEELGKSMLEKKEEILEKVKDAESKKVFYEVWHEPITTAGQKTFINDMIELAGGENIGAKAEGSYPEFDVEVLIEENPEVYILPSTSDPAAIEGLSERPGYEDIQAIKEDNIHIIDGDMVARPGPRIVDALEEIAKAIHPDLL